MNDRTAAARVAVSADRAAVLGLGLLLTCLEAAQRVPCAEITLRRLTKRKVNPLPTIKIGHNLLRISEVQLSQWLEAQTQNGGAE